MSKVTHFFCLLVWIPSGYLARVSLDDSNFSLMRNTTTEKTDVEETESLQSSEVHNNLPQVDTPTSSLRPSNILSTKPPVSSSCIHHSGSKEGEEPLSTIMKKPSDTQTIHMPSNNKREKTHETVSDRISSSSGISCLWYHVYRHVMTGYHDMISHAPSQYLLMIIVFRKSMESQVNISREGFLLSEFQKEKFKSCVWADIIMIGVLFFLILYTFKPQHQTVVPD